MMSIGELLQSGSAPGTDPTLERVTTAALELFAEYGIRRTSMEDVARRAGVSRMTVFRRFTGKQRLIEAVIARELHRGMRELDRAWTSGQTLEERLVAGFEFAATLVRDHPLFDRLLRSEPELLLPLLTTAGEPSLELYRTLIATRLRAEAKAGHLAAVDLDQAAEVMARLGISLCLTQHGKIDLGDHDTVVAFVRLALLPMLQRRTQP